MTYEFNGIEYEDDTMVDLGGGMVVRLAELMEDDEDLRAADQVHPGETAQPTAPAEPRLT